MSIGENIKKYRKLNKLTQKELAEKIGKKERTIRGYEADDTIPPLTVIRKIADFFNIEDIDLIGSDEKAIKSVIKDLKEISDNNIESNITNLYNAILTSIESVNYLECGNKHDLGELLNNTNLYDDIVAVTKDIIKNRLVYYDNLAQKNKQGQK